MTLNMAYGITMVETSDNILFPFATDLLVQYPVNAIISSIVQYTDVNGMNVVKVDINSASIQLYMYLATGFTLQAMSTNQGNNTSNDVNSLLNEYYQYCERSAEHMFEVDNTSILYNGDGFDMLDNDEEFADFDDFVQQNHMELSVH